MPWLIIVEAGGKVQAHEHLGTKVWANVANYFVDKPSLCMPYIWWSFVWMIFTMATWHEAALWVSKGKKNQKDMCIVTTLIDWTFFLVTRTKLASVAGIVAARNCMRQQILDDAKSLPNLTVMLHVWHVEWLKWSVFLAQVSTMRPKYHFSWHGTMQTKHFYLQKFGQKNKTQSKDTGSTYSILIRGEALAPCHLKYINSILIRGEALAPCHLKDTHSEIEHHMIHNTRLTPFSPSIDIHCLLCPWFRL